MKYLIDPTIISILFHTKDEEETAKVLTEIQSRKMILTEEIIKGFLLSKGIDNNKILEMFETFKNSPDDKTPEIDPVIKQLLENDELNKMLDEGISQFHKYIYDGVVPSLSQEEKDTLNSHIDAYEKDEKQSMIDLVDLLSSQTNPAPAVNLGGNLSNPVQPVVPVQPAQPVEPAQPVQATPVSP